MITKEDFERSGGCVQLDRIDFFILGDKEGDEVHIDVEGEDGLTKSVWVKLDVLEQVVNAARAYLGQPVLADEVLELRQHLCPDGDFSITRTDGEKMGFADQMIVGSSLDKIDKALRAMGKLE